MPAATPWSDPTLLPRQVPTGASGCRYLGLAAGAATLLCCLVVGSSPAGGAHYALPARPAVGAASRSVMLTSPNVADVQAARTSPVAQGVAVDMLSTLEGDKGEAELNPKGWRSAALSWGSALYVAGTAAVAYVLGGRQRQQQEDGQAEGMALTKSVRPVAMAATAGASASSGGQVTFLVGLLWFFAQQVIGVGNDVIMKFVGGNLAVAQIVFLRFAFATLTMLPFMLASGPKAFQTDRLPLHVARSLLLAGGIGLYCTGLTIAPITVVTTLNFTIPLFTLVLSRVFLKEKVGPLRWFATLAGFLGVMVVLQPAQMAFNPQWLVVLLGALMFASLDVLNKYFVGRESFWAMIFYTALFTAAISAYPAYQVWAPVTAAQLRLLAMLGAGANLLLYCLLKAFSLVDASALAPFRYTELLFSAAVGFLFFAEVPALTTLLGAAVIIPSTFFVVWQESRAGADGAAGDVAPA
eukprot:EG_transcript_8632